MKKNLSTKSYKVVDWLKMIIIFILLSTITGCIGDELVPVDPKPIDPVVPKAEVYVYAMPSSVVKYNNPVTTIYFVTKNVADSATVNGKTICVKDSINFEFLTKDTTLVFTFTAKNGEKVEKTQLIDVGEPTKIDLMVDLLCLGSLQPEKEETEKSPGVWEDTGMSDSEKSEIWTFYKDGTFTVYNTTKQAYVITRSGGKYSMEEHFLSYGGKKDSIISLTEKELVLGFYIIVYNYEMKQDVNGPRGRITYKRI